MTTPRVTLVIVTWNQEEIVRRCLLSIREHVDSLSHEVIAVDNGSTDGTREMILSEFPEVRVIAKQDNHGYGQGLNEGMRQARGRYIFLLNSDTVLLPGTVNTLTTFMDAHPDAGALGCRLYADSSCSKTQPSAFRVYPTPWNDALDRMIGDRMRRSFPHSSLVRKLTTRWDRQCSGGEHPQEVAFIVGAAMMTRQEVVQEGCFFDEQFHMFFEETDWCRRLRRRGWNIYFIPNAAMIHLHGGSYSTPQLRCARQRHYHDSYLKYLRKYEGWLAVRVAHVLHTLSSARSGAARRHREMVEH